MPPAPPPWTPHTDLRPGGWVARLPAAWRPYALLARLDRPIGVWLLFLPGAWGIALGRAPGRDSAALLGLFALGSVAMRAAGCVVNDLWDRDIDRLVARTAARPLAAGMLRPRQAIGFLAALLAVGLAVLLHLRPLCWAMGLAVLPLAGLYPLAKRITRWPQLAMGFAFGFGAPMGYAAAAGRIDAACLALYAAAIAWDLGFDTVYAHQDRREDAMLGLGSTALLWGERTRPFLAGCYAAMLAALVAAAGLAGLRPGPAAVALLPAAGALAWQALRLDIHDPQGCLRLFRANREAGLLVAAGLIAARLAPA